MWRHVHEKDLIPHSPSSELPLWYMHAANEIYEDKDGKYIHCVGGEDKTCSDQWHSWNLSVDDHLIYMGECMGSTCGQCPTKTNNSETYADYFLQ